MKKAILFVLFLAFLAFGGIFFMNRKRMSGPSWNNLAPTMKAKIIALLDRANAAGLSVMFWEGWRSVEDEQKHIDNGTSKLSDPFNTVHLWGHAADVVFSIAGVPSWPDLSDPRWSELIAIANSVGLVHPISWDGPHFEEPGFKVATIRAEYGNDWAQYLTDKGVNVA